MKPRISMITLGVSDIVKSIGFYEKGLGFPKMEFPSADVAFFTLNGTWLGLFGKEALAKDAQVSPKGSGFNGFALAHNVKTESEVDQVFDQAILSGGKPVKKPQKVFWGGYSGYFQDPDEYLWEVAHNPHAWVGPED